MQESLGTQKPIESRFREAAERLRRAVPHLQVVMLAGPQGVIDQVIDDPSLNVDLVAEEYATLLRIARAASVDSGAGSLVENILVSEKSIMIARAVPPGHCLILLARSQEQIGRARYEVKLAVQTICTP